VTKDDADRTTGGRLFQARGAATGNDLSEIAEKRKAKFECKFIHKACYIMLVTTVKIKVLAVLYCSFHVVLS